MGEQGPEKYEPFDEEMSREGQDFSKKRNEMIEQMSKPTWTRTYELGGHNHPESKELNKVYTGVSIEVGVDATKFKDRRESKDRAPEEFNNYMDAAKGIIACYKLLNKEAQDWFDSLGEDMLRSFIEIGEFEKGDKDYDGTNKDKWQKWLDFVEKYGENSIYEKSGMFNFLLAWLRACDAHQQLKAASKADFDVDNESDYNSLGLAKPSSGAEITFVLGDNINDQSQRYVKKTMENMNPEDDTIIIKAPM